MNPINTTNTVNGTNFHQTLHDFLANCRVDKRLTPNTQLLYRVLTDLANRAYWAYPFEASDRDLKAITHITSDKIITECKRTLKNLGYIDFHGKPSSYTIYSPPAVKVAHKVANSTAPRTPRYNTINTTNTIHTCINNSDNLRSDARDDNATSNPHNGSLQPASGAAATTDSTPLTNADLAEVIRRFRSKRRL